MRDLILERVLVGETTGCWVWQRGRDLDGYARIWSAPNGTLAHRISYEAFVGPVPSGLELDHKCSNPPCVNPDHLEPVTHAENVRRGRSFSAVNARKTHCVNGHPFDATNTYIRSTGQRGCRACNLAAVRRYKSRQEAAA